MYSLFSLFVLLRIRKESWKSLSSDINFIFIFLSMCLLLETQKRFSRILTSARSYTHIFPFFRPLCSIEAEKKYMNVTGRWYGKINQQNLCLDPARNRPGFSFVCQMKSTPWACREKTGTKFTRYCLKSSWNKRGYSIE